MLGNESLWEVATHCHDMLRDSGIAHTVCGGVAVCLHGYQRNTTDVDVIIQPFDMSQVKSLFMENGYVWDESNKEFRSSSGIGIQFLLAGEKAGKGTEVLIPEPVGGAHMNWQETADNLRESLLRNLHELQNQSGDELIENRYRRFRSIGEFEEIKERPLQFKTREFSEIENQEQKVKNPFSAVSA